jgi:hypothetical protein
LRAFVSLKSHKNDGLDLDLNEDVDETHIISRDSKFSECCEDNAEA